MTNKTVKKLTAAFLAVTMVMSSPVTPKISAKAADNTPSLTIDMGETGKRELYHGATGWLYGQGDDQVPTANTITALKPNTAVQKAPNGMQHPNGDVLDIAKTFIDAGGKHIQIYVPDYYALWFYEFTGTDYYLDILEMQAKACIEAGIEDDVVYVLYNEPRENWLGSDGYVDDKGNKVTGWNSMYWYWKAMVEKLREVYKEAGVETAPKTAGLNLAVYDKTVMDGYIKFCAEHDVMPDIVSWHDLATWQYDIFDEEYNHYRGLEKKYGIKEPREIVINEYAAQAECASPGDLVRWIGLWEDYEVAGCLPFWHFSNNLNGLAANNNAGNGAWWLYKWYGDMSGSYLPVSVANADQNDFYGAASIDENKKSANVIFGGRDGSANIILDDILSTDTFKDAAKVHIKVEGTDYTGFHGAAEEPRVIKEGTVAVENGQVIVPMTDMNSMSGYRITVTQAAEDENLGLLAASWKVKYEAEDGTLTGNAEAADPDGSYACSNRKKVHWVDNPGDSVTLDISVPYDGYYKYDYVYCAATGVDTNSPSTNTPYTAIQNLSVDGEQVDEMILPSTLHWSMGGMYSKYLYLTAGSHSMEIEATSSEGKAVPDCIYLTYEGKEEADTLFDMTYEAELGEFNEIKGQTTTLTTSRDGRIGYITGLESRSVTDGGGVRFNTVVPENGMYTITLRYQSQQNATANLYLDNDMTNLNNLRATIALNATGNEWKTVYQEVFLQEGINVIDIDTKGAVKLDSMRVRGTEGSASVVSMEAESGTLAGEAAIGEQSAVQQFASGGGYVSALKAANDVEVIPESDADFTVLGLGRVVDKGEAVDKNSLTINVNVPQAGGYKLVVYQSNGELFGKHSYNAQMTERYASFSVNGATAKKVVFRNTYSDETFMPQVVDVDLQAGDNTIKIYNDNSKVITNGVLKAGLSGESNHRPENIDYAVLTNYTPNFDKFELYALTGKSGEEQNTYEISARTTEGGRIEVEKTQVTAGGSVQLLFVPDDGYYLKEAYINGSSIMDKLTEVGGYYTVYPVSQNIEARAYFELADEKEQITRQTDFEYAVNAGDINPQTLSEGDSFGLRNSVTEQFYAEDAVTGSSWGLIGENLVEESKYPGWLTGSKTWPCENDGATDSSPKEKSFRYARNQATTDAGIVYQFELEPNQTYDVELGFYVPSGWTNTSNPRTMKLVVNDTVVSGYDNFTASNNDANPFKINTQMTADSAGMLKIQIGHASNAVWGPVISYLEIFRQADTADLVAEMDICKDYQETDYDSKSWSAFATARETAQSVLDNSADLTNISTINDALYNLQVAKGQLKAPGTAVDKSELNAVYEQYKDYATTTGQGITSDEDWAEFQSALGNALFLQQTNASETVIANALKRLNLAVSNLAVVNRLAVTKNPSKTTYYVGDALDLTGLEVTAYDQNGKAYILDKSEYTVGNFDFSTAGTKTITVSFQNQTSQFAVEVKNRTDNNVQVQAPAAPKVTTGTCSYNSIQIKWGKVNGAAGYEIYRSTSKNSGYQLVKKIEKQDTISYKDAKLNFNKTYYYKVKAYTQSGTTVAASEFSNMIKAKTALTKPVVKAKKKSKTSINVSWKKVSGASGYQVQYSLKKKSGYKSVTINKKNAKSYTLKKLESKKTYYVKVRAFRKVKSKKRYSSWSKVTTVKLR